MESLITKPRAVAALCAVLLMAAINRQDALIFALFLLVTCIGALGVALPWLSLRFIEIQQSSPERREIHLMELQSHDLQIQMRQRTWWPAFMVEVEAVWTWAGQEFVSRTVVAVLAPGRSISVLDRVRFGCRGHYRLQQVRLRCGFPLGIVAAQRQMAEIQLEAVVTPKPWPAHVPDTWTVSEDVQGDATQGHAGESLELNQLHLYEPGTPIRRIDWRASARAGQLVVRQFQHPASAMVTVLVAAPPAADFGIADAPGEQVLRIAAGACLHLTREAVRYTVRVPGQEPARDPATAANCLAGLAPEGPAVWRNRLQVATRDLRRGEQVLAIVPPQADVGDLSSAAAQAVVNGGRLLVLIALWPGADNAQILAAERCQAALRQVRVDVWMANR